MTESNGPDGADESKLDSNSKVATVIHRRDLGGVGDELVEYWTRDEGRMSLRELADYFNRELLSRTLREASLNTLDGEAANLYRLLSSDDVSSGARVQAKNRLEQHGIDTDRLMDDFVSRQAVHTYLRKHRGVSYAPDDGDPVERETTNIQRLKRRTTTILDSKIERLREADRITLGEFDVLMDIRILCEDCGTQYQATELLERGACECPPESR